MAKVFYRFTRIYATLYAALVYLGLGLGGLWPAAATAAEGILAYGDLRGYVEPCGCDPETDLGGIGRLYQAVSEQRRFVPQGIVVDLGYNLASEPAVTAGDKAKEAAIFAGLAALKPEAALATPRDLAYALLQKAKPHAKSPPRRWLLSNLKTNSQPGIARFIATKGQVILGFVDPAAPRALPLPKPVAGLYKPLGPKLFRSLKAQIAGHQPKKGLIVLYAGRDEGFAALKKAFPQAEFIRANRRPNDALPDHKEREQPGLLLHQGRYSVPSFGGGILTFGRFKNTPRAEAAQAALGNGPGAPPISLGKPAIEGLKRPPAKPLLALPALPVIWLSKAYAFQEGKGDPMTAVLSSYRNSTKDAFIAAADRKAKARIEGSPYAGAAACQACHPGAYKAYMASGHAKAMATLKAKDQHQNGECVSCHVVGYDKPGGYIDERYTKELANVQCENCHGPRKAHTKNPAVKFSGAPAREVCTSCHHVPHSSAFSFAAYWPKIAHGKPGSAPAPAPASAPTPASNPTAKAPGQSLDDILNSTKPVLKSAKYDNSSGCLGPVCGVKNGKKTTFADSCVLAKEGAAVCHDGPCFELCTTQYDPVCGQKNGGSRTYGNSCERTAACATPAPKSACGM